MLPVFFLSPQRKNVKFDPADPSAMLRAASGGMQMAFASLEEGFTKEKTEELASRWAGLLATNNIKCTTYAIDESQILVSEQDGNIFEIKDFFLSQPEVTKFRWKDNDYLPDEEQLAKRAAAGGGKKKKKTKKGGGKKKTKKGGSKKKDSKKKSKKGSKAKTEL